MNTQRVIIDLPESVFRHLADIAEAIHQPVEVLAAQSVINNLPPSWKNAPSELQPELLKLQTLKTEELLAVAQSQVDPHQHERHVELLEKNKAGSLSPEERQELSNLHQSGDRLMLSKAYAWSILR